MHCRARTVTETVETTRKREKERKKEKVVYYRLVTKQLKILFCCAIARFLPCLPLLSPLLFSSLLFLCRSLFKRKFWSEASVHHQIWCWPATIKIFIFLRTRKGQGNVIMKPCLGWFSFISFLFCEFSAFLVHQGKLGKRGARQKRERERERERRR
jgi:hypothetical protein